MTHREFLAQVTSYGVGRPDTENGDFWVKLLSLSPSGSGHPRTYSSLHVRVVVAWQLVLGLCGRVPRLSHLHRDAAWELAEHDSGWVVISEGLVGWTRNPNPALLDAGAVCIPVPMWLDRRTTVR